MKTIISYFIMAMSFVLLLPSCSWLSDKGVFSNKKPVTESRDVPVRDYRVDAQIKDLVADEALVTDLLELSEDKIQDKQGNTISDIPLTPKERAINKLKNQVQFVFYFAFDSADLDEDKTAEIVKHARFMRDNSTFKLRLEGHSDERGGRGYNLALGENRALSVKEILALYGVEDRVDVISYGEEKPADFGHDAAAWQKNRRVELTYY